MKRNIKIALAQLFSKSGDKEYNLSKIREYAKKAADRGADFICFPELYYSGYDINKEEMWQLAEKQDGQLFQKLSEIAKANNIYIVCGYAELSEDGKDTHYATMMVDRNGALIGNHRKVYLSGGQEQENASPGNEYKVIDTEFGKMGILICYEMEYPEPARTLAFQGAEVLFVTSAFMNVHWMSRYLYAIAIHNQVYVAGVNHVGNRKGGCSKIIDQMGLPLAEGSMTGEELIIAEVDLDSKTRRVHPHFNEFKPETLKMCLDAYEKNANVLKSWYDPKDESLGYYTEFD